MQRSHKPRALITGSSSGIGFAYAKHLASLGWLLDLVSNNPSRSDEAQKQLNYPHATSHLADLSKPSEIEQLTKKISAPDLLVANAGITKFAIAGALERKEKKDIFYLLCNGVIDLIEDYLPEMKKKSNSRIVIISSIAALTPMPKSSIYASAKSAIYSYGQSLSKELEQDNIFVTVSLPGYVRTEAHEKAGLGHLKKKIPPWMWIDPEQAVKETESASRRGKSKIIPGIVYKAVSPFLRMPVITRIWNKITRRK